MSKLSEDQHFETVLDHLPYLSTQNLDRVIVIAHAWQTLEPHYAHQELNADGTQKDMEVDDTQ